VQRYSTLCGASNALFAGQHSASRFFFAVIDIDHSRSLVRSHGILASPLALHDDAFLRSCHEAELGIAFIERDLRGFGRSLEYDLVAADDLDGGLQCTQHLLDQGCRRIAFLTGSPTSSHESRLAGYLTALHRSAITQAPLVLEQPQGLATKESYSELARQLISHSVDSVVCYQDYTALGLILELLNQGIRVPADMAITGFDNLAIGKAYSIGITTYAFSAEAVARQPIGRLRDRLRDPSRPPVKVLIPRDLIIRESSQA